MLTIGDKFPEYNLEACVSREPGKEFTDITDKTNAGKWQVIFFWPKDFTFVCPTEIAEFGKNYSEFTTRGAVLLGGSVDTAFVHLAWRNTDKNLQDLPFPMLADTKHELSEALGILRKEDGADMRATFILDPDGIIRWVTVSDDDVGRSVPETIRVLDALQTGVKTPCNWEPGQATL